MVSSVILKSSSKETLGKEETTDPESGGRTIVYPFLHKS